MFLEGILSTEYTSIALLTYYRNVIIVGDLNTSHQPIDSCDASDPDYATSPTRHWLNQLLHDFTTEFQVDYRSAEPGHRMVDTFRSEKESFAAKNRKKFVEILF
jgi:exonuclease III